MALYMTYFFSFDSISHLFSSVNLFLLCFACLFFLIMVVWICSDNKTSVLTFEERGVIYAHTEKVYPLLWSL